MWAKRCPLPLAFLSKMGAKHCRNGYLCWLSNLCSQGAHCGPTQICCANALTSWTLCFGSDKGAKEPFEKCCTEVNRKSPQTPPSQNLPKYPAVGNCVSKLPSSWFHVQSARRWAFPVRVRPVALPRPCFWPTSTRYVSEGGQTFNAAFAHLKTTPDYHKNTWPWNNKNTLQCGLFTRQILFGHLLDIRKLSYWHLTHKVLVSTRIV